MFDVNETGQQASFDAARRHRRFVIQIAAALNGLSWLAMWVVLRDFGRGNKEIPDFFWSLVVVEAFAAAGWFGVGHSYTRSMALSGRIARLAAIAHGVWFALPFVLGALAIVLLGLGGVVAGMLGLAVILAGPIGAFAISFRIAGAIAVLCDVVQPKPPVSEPS